MKYSEFEEIVSSERMRRYLDSCQANTRKAMALYRYNIRLSQELLAVVGCFEVALRNRIDRTFTSRFGADWLRDFVLPGGCLASDPRVAKTRKIIEKAYYELLREGAYSHSRLLTEMGFGFWKFMFSNLQFRLTGRILLQAFPAKPKSSPNNNISNTFIFSELDYINNLRNRIAHHEPIVFNSIGEISTSFVIYRYDKILRLFEWMDIDGNSLLYGLDHVKRNCQKINTLIHLQN